MSRIGRSPISIPSGVSLNIEGGRVEVKGPKGTLVRDILPNVSVKVDAGNVIIEKKGNSKFDRSYFGTSRQLVNNMIDGVTKGFEKKLELVGIGYKAAPKGRGLSLSLGYSHPIDISEVDGVDFKVEGNIITVSGIDKEKVGLVAASIKRKRKPDAYKGKGVRYKGEVIKLKEGKKS
ncbi:MAG TPA: 50S ribosomal protein L6 [Fusobacteria bacterium]|nr:50S ribosomal protein L6 [Fusobacteriota bacterium]|tara:strand:- start:2843 stop:3373 length:531 start_codon:yes stop_codon:yes gene_type:complete